MTLGTPKFIKSTLSPELVAGLSWVAVQESNLIAVNPRKTENAPLLNWGGSRESDELACGWEPFGVSLPLTGEQFGVRIVVTTW